MDDFPTETPSFSVASSNLDYEIVTNTKKMEEEAVEGSQFKPQELSSAAQDCFGVLHSLTTIDVRLTSSGTCTSLA
ncbi:hypothetical protein HAX54_020371 [Datura stramonium]|uniref:Uncharacterized protein n=1 Tax=Datura stramonium TaxID=4076 RepID=A0ABS8UR37_DATST|nr:hypothetical protein [Datura stramonium]